MPVMRSVMPVMLLFLKERALSEMLRQHNFHQQQPLS